MVRVQVTALAADVKGASAAHVASEEPDNKLDVRNIESLLQVAGNVEETSKRRAHAFYELGRKGKQPGTTESECSKIVGAAHACLHEGSSEEMMREALFALGRSAKVGEALAIEALLKALSHDEYPQVRQQAAEALRWLAFRGDNAAISALLSSVQHDPAVGVRRDAAHALAEVTEPGDMETAKILMAQLSSDGGEQCEDVRHFLAFALGCIANTQEAEAVSALLCHLLRGETARQVAGEALSRLFGDRESLPALALFIARIEVMERHLDELRGQVAAERARDASRQGRARSRSHGRADDGPSQSEL